MESKNFICGGALGFDHIAASMVLLKRQNGMNVRLIIALPCHNQEVKWSERQKSLHRFLLDEAEEIRYISEEYANDCMKERNHYMVDNSAYCICALSRSFSGTAQTVRYAKQQGLQVINVAKS